MIRVRVTYIGRVQGVGFRATTRSVARQFPVTGWVRNEENGSVMMEVQGEEASVNAFCAEVRRNLSRFIVSESAMPLPAAAGEVHFLIRQ